MPDRSYLQPAAKGEPGYRPIALKPPAPLQRTRICYMIGALELCGTAVHLLSLIRNLDRTRYDPWVVALVKGGPIAGAIRRMGIEVLEPEVRLIYSWRAVRTVFSLAARIRRTRTQIVQSYLFTDNLLGPLAARLGGARAVITGRRVVDDWEPLRQRRAYRLTNRLVDRIVVVSRDVEDSVRRCEKAPDSKIVLIENAQSRDTLMSRADGSNRLFLEQLDRKIGRGFVYGTIGNLRRQKAHDILVRAFHRVLREHPDSHLVIVGTGPYYAPTDALVRELGIQDSVHLVGQQADVASFLDRFSVFVMSSHAEGMSNALLEALIFEKPAIATRSGLPSDADGRDLVLPVEPGDEAGLAEAMLRVRRDPELRERLSNRARAYVESTMDEGRMAREFEALYEELLR